MATDAQTLLDNVNDAINAILTGGAVQSYSVNGRNLSRMSLKDLRELRRELQSEANNSATAGSMRNKARFVRPR